MGKRAKGFVEGVRFESGKEMVYLIYKEYCKKNPSITLDDMRRELEKYQFTAINDMNERSFFKSESTYNLLDDDKKIKFYCSIPFVFDGKNYYLKTETGEPETSEHIRFAKDHGINISFVSVPINSEIEKLKEHNNDLISFYVAETKSVLTKEQYEKLSNIMVLIDNTYELYFEIVGRYDLRDIVKEIENILDDNRNVSDFRRYLEELLQLLYQLLDLEFNCQYYKEKEFFTIPNSSYYVSKEYKNEVNDIENSIKKIIERIKEMLNSNLWSEETKELINDILNRIAPKILSRRRLKTVLGTFNASKYQITLYKKAIKDWLPKVELDKKMLDVYSHELFHAFHYVHMKDNTKWEYDDSSRIVKESLATYIEYKFGLFNINNTEITSDLIRMWNDYDMYDFPYAGAKYVGKYLGLCELMFKESIASGTNEAFHLIETASKI